MVTVEVTQGKMPMASYLIQAAGFGKSLVKNVRTEQDAIRWRDIAPSRLILEKLKGVLAQRKIAYQAKKFSHRTKWQTLNELHYFCDQVSDTAPQRIYRMVVTHQNKWRWILPKEANKMNADVEEIISFCKENMISNKSIYQYFLDNSHLTIADIANHFGISAAYTSKIISAQLPKHE